MTVVCIEMVITLLWLEKQEGEEQHKLWQAIEDQNIIGLESCIGQGLGALFRPLFTTKRTPEQMEATQSNGLKSSPCLYHVSYVTYVWRWKQSI